MIVRYGPVGKVQMQECFLTIEGVLDTYVLDFILVMRFFSSQFVITLLAIQ